MCESIQGVSNFYQWSNLDGIKYIGAVESSKWLKLGWVRNSDSAVVCTIDIICIQKVPHLAYHQSSYIVS